MTLVRESGSAAARLPVIRQRLRRTPERLALATAVLIVLGLATGVAAAVGVRQRIDLINGATARNGDLAVASQRLYRALSDADATAANAFLTGGVEPAALRERYQAGIADASAALAIVSGGRAGGERGDAAVARIAAQLPVYTGLVETARVYNRQGLPIGGAYLREASGVMRERLLPAAQQLYEAVSDELDESRDGAAAYPWFATLLGLVTIAALVIVQRYLTRRTNRVFNVGLVAATAAASLLVVWLGLSAVLAGGRLEASRTEGSDRVARLVNARIAALEARADEAHTLVARGNGGAYEKHYAEVAMPQVTSQLSMPDADPTTRIAADAARIDAEAWVTAHQKLRALDDGGQYDQAVAAAVGGSVDSTSSIAARLDGKLARAIDHNGQVFDREVDGAAGALAGADIGTGLLATLMVVGVALGIQRRLVEYR